MRLTRFTDALAGAKVGAKSEKMWKQFVHTLEEIAPGGKLIAPSSAIESIVEAVYEDYAKTKFPNYEVRKRGTERARQLRASIFGDPAEFLSQLALVTALETANKQSTPEVRNETTRSV